MPAIKKQSSKKNEIKKPAMNKKRTDKSVKTKINTKKIVNQIENLDQTVDKLSKEMEDILIKLKTKYNSLDKQSKKKIITGVATIGSLLVVGMATHRARRKKKK